MAPSPLTLSNAASCGLRSGRFSYSTTYSGGCLGSSSGEGRSELRYAQRCAEFRELQSVERTAPLAQLEVRLARCLVLLIPRELRFVGTFRVPLECFTRWHVGSAQVCTRVAFQRGFT